MSTSGIGSGGRRPPVKGTKGQTARASKAGKGKTVKGKAVKGKTVKGKAVKGKTVKGKTAAAKEEKEQTLRFRSDKLIKGKKGSRSAEQVTGRSGRAILSAPKAPVSGDGALARDLNARRSASRPARSGGSGAAMPGATRARSNAVSGDEHRPVVGRPRSNAISGDEHRPVVGRPRANAFSGGTAPGAASPWKTRTGTRNNNRGFAGRSTNYSSKDTSRTWGSREGGKMDFSPGSYGAGKTLAEYDEAVLRFGKVNDKKSGDWGELGIAGETRILSARARAYWSPRIDLSSGTIELAIGVQARAELIGATYGIEYQKTAFTVGGVPVNFRANANADVFVGTQANAAATLSLGREPNITVGAGAFAGASATIQGGATFGGVGTTGSASGWVGVGAKAEAQATYKNGKLKFGFELGAALGLGASAKFGLEIDVFEFAKVATGVGNALKKPAVAVGKAIAKGAKSVAKAASKVGKSVAKAAKSVGSSIKKAFKGW